MTQHQSTAALVQAELLPCCSVLLCKTCSQHACATATTPLDMWSPLRCAANTLMKACCSYSCAMTQHQCPATVFLATSNHHCPVLLCITGVLQACVRADTPAKTCSPYSSAMTQHHCTFSAEPSVSRTALVLPQGCQDHWRLVEVMHVHICTETHVSRTALALPQLTQMHQRDATCRKSAARG